MAGRKAGHFLSRVSCWSGLRVLFAYDAGYARPFRLRHRLPQNAGNITARESEQRSGRSLLLQLSAFYSSRINRGVAPHLARVSFGSFLLWFFAATLRSIQGRTAGAARPATTFDAFANVSTGD
jgi:hypothetical protein